MSVSDAAALTAALCVALSNLIAPAAIRHFGPVVFNCWRLSAALLALLLLTTLRGAWTMISLADLAALVISSVVGIVIGDSAIYAAMQRLGPRRAAVLYATNAPFAATLGFLFLGEKLPTLKVVGIALVVVGVWIAIAYRENNSVGHWEEIRGRPIVGAAFGLTGGFSAALAAFIARPVMAAGVDPIAAASVRGAVGLLGLALLARLQGAPPVELAEARMLTRAALSGILGMAAGMTLVLFALAMRPTGIVTTLASTTPVLLLPLLLVSRKRPAPQAWFGAVLTVAGIAALADLF